MFSIKVCCGVLSVTLGHTCLYKVGLSIENLVRNRCAAQVDSQPYICSPLSVVSNSAGKLRLVLNLKYLNQFLHVLSFKYEDLRTAALMFEPGEYMFKFDLKSGYHHVDVHPDYQKYLGFQWEANGIAKIMCLRFCHSDLLLHTTVQI